MSNTVMRYGYDPTHPVFRVPPHETLIWRYMPMKKLEHLLETQQLHLCRASEFEDDHEGSVTAGSEAELAEFETLVRASPKDMEYFRAVRTETRNQVAVCCWHMATLETEGMWVRYGKTEECVAIRSTVGRLVAALPQQRNPEQADLESVYVGEVEYIDFSRDSFPPTHTFYPYLHKRQEYRHEQEVRVIALITDEAERDFGAGTVTEFAVTENGFLLPVNVSTLIEAVVISPKATPAFERGVRENLDRFGFSSTPVVKSAMAGTPIY